MLKNFFRLTIFIALVFPNVNAAGQVSGKLFLSGIDKDNTVDWEFFCTAGRQSGTWTKIPVPSCWELQGFGTYNYGHDHDSIRGKEEGIYRYRFSVPGAWKDISVDIVFEGVMTDAEVKINGKSAGASHQGGFYEFRYEVGKFLNYGKENLLEVTVAKHSSNESVNNAERRSDYWIFGGIYRPVYLESRPNVHINSIAVDARADGNLNCTVSIASPGKSMGLELKLYSLDGSLKGSSSRFPVSPGAAATIVTEYFPDVEMWSPEFPNLYTLEVILFNDKSIIHKISEKIGFRTVEVREHDGIYINGTKIRFKGVCRHSFWPASGRTTSKKISIDDINLMKSMNMNAVRMSHYPPDRHFLDACDSLGLFVLDELAGWQHAYDTEIGKKLVKETVMRDVNHPSIVLWDNGNEGGWNRDIDDEFAKYDPQKREVIHPWENFRKTDTHHYIEYNYGTSDFFNGDQVFFPTEFLHGLYDGGLGAGLEDFWNLMLSKPLSAGGFLWVFTDESVSRTDRGGELDSDGNHAPDGILGPNREKEGSYYAIREIWSPVFFEDRIITAGFDGILNIENRYHFTNLNQCRFSYQFVRFDLSDKENPAEKILSEGEIKSPNIEPGRNGVLEMKLPGDWESADYMNITVVDPGNRKILTWNRPISSVQKMATLFLPSMAGSHATAKEEGDNVILNAGNVTVSILKSTGKINQVKSGDKIIPLGNGPTYAGGRIEVAQSRIFTENNNVIYEATTEGNVKLIKWTMLDNGMVKLNFRYNPGTKQAFYGINFDFPENQVSGASWVGAGPYRVWKNRMKGTSFGLWEKKYNNTVTGESFVYPEFKGYYADMYWMKLQNNVKDFRIFTTTPHLFMRLFTPDEPKGGEMNTVMTFPEGDISFLHGIAPIGTKTQLPRDLGPQSQLNLYRSHNPYIEIELYFDFR